MVADGGSIMVKFWNGKSYKATLVGSDTSTDLAVIKVDRALVGAPPGRRSATRTRSWSATGSSRSAARSASQGTLTSGIVSALHRQMDAPNKFTINDSIQTDAPINHGNSGGPLINMLGQVIGVNTQIQSDSGGSDGVGFAIPSNTVAKVVSQIVAGKTVAVRLPRDQRLDSSTPAGAARRRGQPRHARRGRGLQTGDVIVKLDGKTIASGDDLSTVISDKKPGDKLKVTYVRHSKATTITVTLGTRPS